MSARLISLQGRVERSELLRSRYWGLLGLLDGSCATGGVENPYPDGEKQADKDEYAQKQPGNIGSAELSFSCHA
jgi:hypothetical protein